MYARFAASLQKPALSGEKRINNLKNGQNAFDAQRTGLSGALCANRWGNHVGNITKKIKKMYQIFLSMFINFFSKMLAFPVCIWYYT